MDIVPWAGYSAALSFTFDDAQPSHVAHLKSLTETKALMTFFVNSNVRFPGSTEAWQWAVKAGHELGNHTASHPHLLPGSPMSAGVFGETAPSPEAELDRCEGFILHEAGQNGVWTFASPYGDEGWEPIAAARYPLVRSVAQGMVAADGGSLPSHLPCYMAMPGETAAGTFIPRVKECRQEQSWLIFCFHSVLPTEENWYAGVGIEEITGTARYALDMKDIWVDTFARIGAYWRARNIVQNGAPVPVSGGYEWSWTIPPGFPKGTTLLARPRGGSLLQNNEPLLPDAKGNCWVSFDEGSVVLRFD